MDRFYDSLSSAQELAFFNALGIQSDYEESMRVKAPAPRLWILKDGDLSEITAAPTVSAVALATGMVASKREFNRLSGSLRIRDFFALDPWRPVGDDVLPRGEYELAIGKIRRLRFIVPGENNSFRVWRSHVKENL